jgi:hypothetical protein
MVTKLLTTFQYCYVADADVLAACKPSMMLLQESLQGPRQKLSSASQ